MSLELTKLSETATKITLGWALVPGAIGYRFQSKTTTPKWSHTFDATRDRVTFSKTDWYKVEALGVEAAGEYPTATPPPPPPPPPASHMLPASRVTLDPGEIAAWVVHRSPTTEIMGDGSSRDEHRVIRWSSDGKYAGRRMVALIGVKLIEGYPGRFWNCHSRPGSPGWNGQSPFAIDLYAARVDLPKPGMEITLAAEGAAGRPYHFQIMSDAEARSYYGRQMWLWLDNRWARRSTGGGSCKVYLAGEDSPRVNVANLDMHWVEDEPLGLTLWEGEYDSSKADVRSTVDLAASRIGRDPRECFEDSPSVFVREPAGIPGGSVVAMPDVDGGGVPVPLPLRWS